MSVEPQVEVEGVPAAQLKAVLDEYLDVSLKLFAERIGLDWGYFSRIVLNPTNPVVKLSMAERICDGLDLSVTALINRDELTIVPLKDSKRAVMALVESQEAFEFEEFGWEWTEDERVEVENSLREAYRENVQLTERQLTKREADAQRKRRRDKGSPAA